MLLKVIFIALFPALIVALDRPDDISAEMYCMGCQTVLKELDMVLMHPPTRGIGETVSRALKQVCHENNFKKYEINYKTALKVCKHIKDDDGLEQILTSEYSRIHELKHKTSYLPITQKVCGSYLKACVDVSTLEHGEDGGIIYDPDTQTFDIKSGPKVRTAKPVSAQKANSNKTPSPETKAHSTTPEKPPTPTPAMLNLETHDEL